MLLAARPIFEDESDVVRLNDAWYASQTEQYGLLLCFVKGREEEERRWMVRKRLDANRVEAIQMGTTRARLVCFDGPLDAAEMALSGASVEVLAQFRNGFPETWDEIWPRPPPPPPLVQSKTTTRRLQIEQEDDINGEVQPRRSKRKRDTEEKPCYDEDDLLLRALRKEEAKDHILEIFGIREEEMTDEEEENDWSEEEIKTFHQARLVLNPLSPDFWQRMSSEFVITRTACECQERWLHDSKSSNNRKKGGDGVEFKGVSEEDAMLQEERAAKMGTVKFRRQVRNDWEKAHRKDSKARDNLTTPFRTKVENEHVPQSCCKDIYTPVNTFAFGEQEDEKKKKNMRNLPNVYEDSEEDEEHVHLAPSPDVLVEVNRDNLDGYLMGLVKEKKKLQNLQTKNSNKPLQQRQPVNQRFRAQTSGTSASSTHVEGDGIQGTLTPGGTVKLAVDRTMYANNQEDAENVGWNGDDDDDEEKDEF